jgi:hypothetical protein
MLNGQHYAPACQVLVLESSLHPVGMRTTGINLQQKPCTSRPDLPAAG